MPIISLFFGIVIYMYNDDHFPPNFHAKYQNQEAMFTLEGDLLKGSLPHKKRQMVEVWAEIHREDLLTAWEIAKSGRTPFRIEPLK